MISIYKSVHLVVFLELIFCPACAACVSLVCWPRPFPVNLDVVVVDDRPAPEEPLPFDADIGFQQVRSKKNNKEAARKNDDSSKRPSSKDGSRGKGGGKQSSGPATATSSTTSVSTTLSSSPSISQHSLSTKSYESRPRNKLPPRLMKVKESERVRKSQHHQQQHNADEVAQMNKINESMSLFQIKGKFYFKLYKLL